jgi:hypothetical protein
LLPSAKAAERFIETAAAAGVELRRCYRPSLSCWPETRCFEACPIAEDFADRLCVLPVRAVTADSETVQIVDLVLDALDRALTRH